MTGFGFIVVWCFCFVFILKESRTENQKFPAKHRSHFVITFRINLIPSSIPNNYTCAYTCHEPFISVLFILLRLQVTLRKRVCVKCIWGLCYNWKVPRKWGSIRHFLISRVISMSLSLSPSPCLLNHSSYKILAQPPWCSPPTTYRNIAFEAHHLHPVLTKPSGNMILSRISFLKATFPLVSDLPLIIPSNSLYSGIYTLFPLM